MEPDVAADVDKIPKGTYPGTCQYLTVELAISITTANSRGATSSPEAATAADEVTK